MRTKLSKQQEEKEKTKERQKELTISKVVYGKRVVDPILGNFYSVPRRDTQRHEFQLDTSFAYVRFGGGFVGGGDGRNFVCRSLFINI